MSQADGQNMLTDEISVFVCGSLHLDLVIDAPHLPRNDETVVGTNVQYVCGGKGGNQAVAAALNGANTAFAGCIGNDEFGGTLKTHLQSHNIDCSGLQTTPGASGMSVAIVDSKGDYGAVIASGANQCIDTDAIAIPQSTSILLLQHEIPAAVNEALARQATALDIPVMLNAAPYQTISDSVENLIDILVLNRVEAEQFFGSTFNGSGDVVAALQNTGSPIKLIIVTLGADGLVYRDNAGAVHEKRAYPVTVASSHGAGDMFCGALASRFIAGANNDSALDYAMAAAACLVSLPADSRSTITQETVHALVLNLRS